jgi:hypothetical protein
LIQILEEYELIDFTYKTITKYQRKDCSRITDKTAGNFSNKIVDLTTSREIGMVKFKMKMSYYDSEIAIGYINIYTGECFFSHKNGKYWGYKKYNMKETTRMLADVFSSLWNLHITFPVNQYTIFPN